MLALDLKDSLDQQKCLRIFTTQALTLDRQYVMPTHKHRYTKDIFIKYLLLMDSVFIVAICVLVAVAFA